MKKILLAFIFSLIFSALAHANCTITALPFVLQNGTTADATQVMANFNQLFNGVQAGCAGAGANTDITSLQGVTSGAAASAGQIGELKFVSSQGASAGVAFNNGSPNITWGASTPTVGQTVYFTTTGSLPTNFSPLTNYYVIFQSGTTIQVSSTWNGSAISAGSSGSGTQTGTNAAYLVNATARDIAFITLTAGDWTCSANTAFSWNGTGTYQVITASIGVAPNTYNGVGTAGAIYDGNTVGNLNANQAYALGEVDTNSVSQVTLFLNSTASFSGGAAVASFGTLRCRRVR